MLRKLCVLSSLFLAFSLVSLLKTRATSLFTTPSR